MDCTLYLTIVRCCYEQVGGCTFGIIVHVYYMPQEATPNVSSLAVTTSTPYTSYVFLCNALHYTKRRRYKIRLTQKKII